MLLKDTSRSMAGPRARGHVTSRDQRLAVDMWDPVGPERGAAVLFHGYGAYSRYPTVLWAAEVLGPVQVPAPVRARPALRRVPPSNLACNRVNQLSVAVVAHSVRVRKH